jgi:uncharacterized membrane protein
MDERYDWAGLYHHRDDPRLFVPKRNPSFGWTINVEHPYGRAILAIILMLPLVGIILGVVTEYRH